MENEAMKKCPYCAEMIREEAIKCRYCGSMLTRKPLKLDFLSTPGCWHRVNEGKKVGGVCTGIAYQLDSPILILPLRLFFILTTIFYGFGVLLYVILWILMPPPTDTQGGERETARDADDSAKSEEVAIGSPPADQGDRAELTSRSRFSVPCVLGGFGVLVLIRLYIAALEHLLGVEMSASVLAFGFLAVGGLLACTGIIVYRRTQHPVVATC